MRTSLQSRGWVGDGVGGGGRSRGCEGGEGGGGGDTEQVYCSGLEETL